MIIYKDAVTGDELFSDTYPMKLIDECIFEVQGKYMTERTNISDDMFGGNASAEGGGDDEGESDISKSGIDIIMANRLVDVPFSKKQYQKYIKEYMKEIITRLGDNQEKVNTFKKQASVAVKNILELWDKREYQFFVGESYNVDTGHVALMYYPEDGDGLSPKMLFFKDGLKEEKV